MCYHSFNKYLQNKYHTRVHRLSLDAGFTCPTRDGSLDTNGCIYCNEGAFSRFSRKNIPLREQIERSMAFARERFKAEKFIAYFQAASGTYAPVEDLKRTYDVIKDFDEIVGLFISTRPDCIDDEKLALIGSYNNDYEVWIEYGLQTIHNKTLEVINRKHSFERTKEAIDVTARIGIKVAVHVILGLPGETESDMIETAKEISRLPVSGVKLHVLHVLKGTHLERSYSQGKVKLLTEDEYIKVASTFLRHLREDIVIMRLVSDADPKFLIAPAWINEKMRIIEGIKSAFQAQNTRQGAA